MKTHELIGLIAAIMQILGVAGILSWSFLKRRQSYNALIVAKVTGIAFKIAVLFIIFAGIGREVYLVSFFGIFNLLGGKSDGPSLWSEEAALTSAISHLIVCFLWSTPLVIIIYFVFTLSISQTLQFIGKIFNYKPQITTELISDLIILEAEYFTDAEHRYSIADELSKLVMNNKLSVRINNDLKGIDPHQDTLKKFRIKYSYRGKVDEIEGSEGQIVEIG